MTEDREKLGYCEGCSKPIFEGDLHHYSGDACWLCEDCAPMLSDAVHQMDQALKDGDWELWYGDFYESEGALRAYRDAKVAEIAAKGDRKLVTRGQA